MVLDKLNELVWGLPPAVETEVAELAMKQQN
jgi:hypothetical protein